MSSKAEDTGLKRPVALKFLATHLLQDEEARKRFQRDLCFLHRTRSPLPLLDVHCHHISRQSVYR